MVALKCAIKSILPARAERVARGLHSGVMDARAKRYLRMTANWHAGDGVPKVAFLAYVPGSWDMQRYVYEEFRSRDDVNVDVVVLPNYGNDMRLTKEYGDELDYFRGLYSDAIVAYQDDGSLFDLKSRGYDYVFYQSPYDAHYPKAYRSVNVMKHSKVCYIPYGFYGSKAFETASGNRNFMRNVYFFFADCAAQLQAQEEEFPNTLEEGLQHFECFGFSPFEKYLTAPKKGPDSLLWTPRWSYDEKVGGSHFLEYKEGVLGLRQRYPGLSVKVRPHPMMFAELRNKGLFSAEEERAFKEKCEEVGVALSEGTALEDDLLDAGLLLSDYSSILAPFSATGRPIIYCDGGFDLVGTMRELSKGMYVARSWKDVEACLDDVLSEKDDMSTTRKRIVNETIGESAGAAKRIVDCVLQDYKSSRVTNRCP